MTNNEEICYLVLREMYRHSTNDVLKNHILAVIRTLTKEYPALYETFLHENY